MTIRGRIGFGDPRAWLLGAFAFVYWTRFLAYTPWVQKPNDSALGGLDLLTTVVPLWIYAVVWAVGGCIVVFLAAKGRKDIGLTAIAAWPPAIWGLSYLFSWAASSKSVIDWRPGTIYLAMVVLVIAAIRVTPKRRR